MSSLPFYLVDVFAESKLEGNQLAVFDNAGELNKETMQAIAKETNLAETTFITAKNGDTFDVRIFTTEYENTPLPPKYPFSEQKIYNCVL